MSHEIHSLGIRQMEKRDLPTILELINIEGWNYDMSEMERILKVSPGSSLVACVEGKVVGGITIGIVGDRCVLGHVVIRDGWRGKGVGANLMDKVIRNMESLGVSIFEVLSIKDAIPFYRRHGFRLVEVLDTHTKTLTADDVKHIKYERIRTLSSNDSDMICELNIRVTGFDRHRIIQCFLEDFPGMAKGLFEKDRLIGFIMARTNPRMTDIGPWTMSNPNVADGTRLFHSILMELPVDRMTIFGVSVDNRIAKEIAAANGFKSTYDNYRMVKSKCEIGPFAEGILAISAFEFG